MPISECLFKMGVMVVCAILGASDVSHAKIIQEITENMEDATLLEYKDAHGGESCNFMREVRPSGAVRDTTAQASGATGAIAQVRGGEKAFEHRILKCGQRSELSSMETKIGETYWYGWSMRLPADWQDSLEGFDILNQWHTYPVNNKDFRPAKAGGRSGGCGAAGSHMVISNNVIRFKFQRQGKSTPIACDVYPLTPIAPMVNKWVDFVMQVKWTGNDDGFLKMWMKIGDEPYVQKLDIKGATFWNDEGTGPYFKFGLYKGDPNFKGPAPRTLYTDEHRLGDAASTFEEVAPRRQPSERIVLPQPSERIVLPQPAPSSCLALVLADNWLRVLCKS